MSRKQVMVCDGCGLRNEGNQHGLFPGWVDLRIHDRCADVCHHCIAQILLTIPALSCLFPCESDLPCGPKFKCRVHAP